MTERKKRGFNVFITTCYDYPHKVWGLRKCGKNDRWFDYFEIENGIVPWCPILNNPALNEVD